MLKMLTWIRFLTIEKIDGNINWAYIMQKSKVRVSYYFLKYMQLFIKELKFKLF